MKKKLLYFSVITVATSLSAFAAFAQSSPIFVQRFEQNRASSNTPFITNNNQGSQTPVIDEESFLYDYIKDAPKFEIVDGPDPFEGTSFGKVTSEVDYFDEATKTFVNQYDYMSLLTQRGQTDELREVANYLKSDGVLDNNKLRDAIAAGQKGTTLSEMEEAAAGAAGGVAGGVGGGIPTPSNGGVATASPSGANVIYRQKDKEDDFSPKRLHQSYDEDMQDGAVKRNQPIFLR